MFENHPESLLFVVLAVLLLLLLLFFTLVEKKTFSSKYVLFNIDTISLFSLATHLQRYYSLSSYLWNVFLAWLLPAPRRMSGWMIKRRVCVSVEIFLLLFSDYISPIISFATIWIQLPQCVQYDEIEQYARYQKGKKKKKIIGNDIYLM